MRRRQQFETHALAWSPDGTQLACGGRSMGKVNLQVWEVATKRTLLTYSGHGNAVETVAWSPDGTRIASGGVDKTVQVWDAATGVLLITYRGHTAFVTSVAWSPDGRWIASGSAD